MHNVNIAEPDDESSTCYKLITSIEVSKNESLDPGRLGVNLHFNNIGIKDKKILKYVAFKLFKFDKERLRYEEGGKYLIT